MTPEEKAIEWRRLAGVYRGLAAEADRRAEGLLQRDATPGPYYLSWGGPGIDILTTGGRPVAVGLSTADARHYESLLNAGSITEAELP